MGNSILHGKVRWIQLSCYHSNRVIVIGFPLEKNKLGVWFSNCMKWRKMSTMSVDFVDRCTQCTHTHRRSCAAKLTHFELHTNLNIMLPLAVSPSHTYTHTQITKITWSFEVNKGNVKGHSFNVKIWKYQRFNAKTISITQIFIIMIVAWYLIAIWLVGKMRTVRWSFRIVSPGICHNQPNGDRWKWKCENEKDLLNCVGNCIWGEPQMRRHHAFRSFFCFALDSVSLKIV